MPKTDSVASAVKGTAARVTYVVQWQSILDGQWFNTGGVFAEPYATLTEAIAEFDRCASRSKRIMAQKQVSKWLVSSERKRMSAALPDQHGPAGEGRTNPKGSS